MQWLVFFDLNNTLVDRQSAFTARAREFAEERGLGYEAVPWLKAADGQGHGPRDQFFRAVREHFGLAEPAEELWAGFRARMPELVRCAPEVPEGLSQLRASGWRVGIVSNGMADNQHELAAERCGTDLAAGGWMIGDSPEHDVAGGPAAGLRTMWIGRQGLAEGRAAGRPDGSRCQPGRLPPSSPAR
ncbi:HAD family hydrolase [Streptomyces sp. NRRL S-481]|uniref:HAD family hydrolase n=1 Tax=Streptomyces sp. NRRL S-481 TaxID=1463911 RepID=UPI000A719A70|nr:HAD family hydrolase [Streptomyces sp. NRRL S-481]